ncbi:hypothetical protein CERZMDRAFT_99676 [Cercospora zeae-maydis SCOH1-5]|uniref:Uncharacterized protein n=1 Tax=Cercospora zeae-maydis SCOH1-5 TaxID=717836 RepID=A0A6A6FA10_9PEZI|nr:hypothetical protein CERZMDRAFT_99676 [Cercospora zeae-maydis SCOH1-5]
MAYGSPIWYDRADLGIGRNKSIYPLQVAQNRCLRAIAGAYRTTATAELEHETGTKPLDIFLKRTAREYGKETATATTSAIIDQARQQVAEQARAQYNARHDGHAQRI